MRSALLALSLLGAGCGLLQQSFLGRACDSSHPCPNGLFCDPMQLVCTHAPDGSPGASCTEGATCATGLVCNPYLAACESDALCHLFDSETQVTCAGRDFYVSPTGSDTASGTSPSDPNATVGVTAVLPGDRFHLAAGSYSANVLSGTQPSATPGCPVQVFGPDAGPDGGGMAILQQPVSFQGDYWWLHDLRFEVAVGQPAMMFGGQNVRLERLVMRNNYPDNTYPRDFEPQYGTDQPTIIDCDINSVNGQVLLGQGSTNMRFIGNRVVANADAQLAVGYGTLILGNDFTGAWHSPMAQGVSGQGVVFIRNVFHDLVQVTGGDLTLVDGADELRSNTFLRVARGTVATGGIFRDNLVSDVGVGTLLPAADAGAGYNLFENVTQPYASGNGTGDQSGPSMLDANDVPQVGSAAWETADPALPVPPGGGARADMGARQHGATALPDGRYCMDGGG